MDAASMTMERNSGTSTEVLYMHAVEFRYKSTTARDRGYPRFHEASLPDLFVLIVDSRRGKAHALCR